MNKQEIERATREAVRKQLPAKLAGLGAAVVAVETERERVAKDLDQAAARWKAKADTISPRTGEVARYYDAKSKSARDKAAAIRSGKDVK